MPEKTLREALVDVADAIRAKTESQETMTIEEMPGEIASIITPTGTKNIVANGDNIDVYNYASVNVNVPNPSSGTLEITENGDYDVTNYANASVAVEGGGSFEANYLYPTDENGAILSEQGRELDDIHIYYDDNGLTSLYPGSGSVYFFENNIPRVINMMTGRLYYYDGNPCCPVSQCLDEDVGDGWLYIGDTNTETLIRRLSFPEDTATLMYNLADDSDPQDGDYYQFSSETGCQPLRKIYFSDNFLYYVSSQGMVDSSGSIAEDVLYLINGNPDRVSTSQVGNLAVGQETTITIYRNSNNERYKITRLTDE